MRKNKKCTDLRANTFTENKTHLTILLLSFNVPSGEIKSWYKKIKFFTNKTLRFFFFPICMLFGMLVCVEQILRLQFIFCPWVLLRFLLFLTSYFAILNGKCNQFWIVCTRTMYLHVLHPEDWFHMIFYNMFVLICLFPWFYVILKAA